MAQADRNSHSGFRTHVGARPRLPRPSDARRCSGPPAAVVCGRNQISRAMLGQAGEGACLYVGRSERCMTLCPL